MGNIYLSWDVGIANLAYCMIEKIDEQTAQFNIIKWGIINLREESMFCNGKGKNNIPCSQRAMFCSNSGIQYCKTHSKKYFPAEINESQCKDNEKCVHIELCGLFIYF